MKYELSIKAAAKILNVSESRISQLLSDGTLDSTTIRGNRRISRESIDLYEAQRANRGRKPIAAKKTTRKFTLMNAEHEIMDVMFDPTSDLPFIGTQVYDASRAPLSVLTSTGACKRREFNEWWGHRSIPSSRPGLERKLIELGLNDAGDLTLRSLGLSLSDCYWLRPLESPQMEWSQINYFQNDFMESSTGSWDDWLAGVGVDSPDNTSEGELPKKWVIRENKRVLIKGFRNDDQRPCNEVVATALYERLLSPDDFVKYEFTQTKDGIACACENFLDVNEEYIPAVYIKRVAGATRGKTEYDRFCKFTGKLGMNEQRTRESLGKMIVCDYLLSNNDRHWRNFGFIRNIETLEMRPAPLFDTGNCLWQNKTANEVLRNDWDFISGPFAARPEQQLSLAEHLDWFNADALDGFVEETLEILARSSYASEPARRKYIEKGLRKRVSDTCAIVSVLRYR